MMLTARALGSRKNMTAPARVRRAASHKRSTTPKHAGSPDGPMREKSSKYWVMTMESNRIMIAARTFASLLRLSTQAPPPKGWPSCTVLNQVRDRVPDRDDAEAEV